MKATSPTGYELCR